MAEDKQRESNKALGKEGRADAETDNKIIKTQQFIYNNSKKISYISIGIIAIVALAFIIRNTVQKGDEEDRQAAMLAIDRVLPYYSSQDYRTALTGDSNRTIRGDRVIGLIEIVEKYEGVKQANLAALFAGRSYLAMGKIDDAIEYFEIAEESPSKIVIQGACAGFGACYESKGEFEKSSEFYLKASELAVTDDSKNRYLYFAGLALENSGDKEDAESLYKRLIAANKYSKFANQAKAGLARLGIEIE